MAHLLVGAHITLNCAVIKGIGLAGGGHALHYLGHTHGKWWQSNILNILCRMEKAAMT
jgi:hypothetical protein